MKRHNIRITGTPEGEKKKQGIETLFEKIMTKNLPKMERKKPHKCRRHRVPIKRNERGILQDIS